MQTFTSDDGMSQSSVHCMLQDKYGFLWLGTYDGLNKYDGYKFTVLKDGPPGSNALTARNVKSLAEDKNGILWVGTAMGLNRLNTLTGEVEQFVRDPKNSNSLACNEVVKVKVDSKGLIWIGTPEGLNLFDYKRKKFQWFTNHPNDTTTITGLDVTFIYEDRKARIWIGTMRGLNCFDRATGKFRRFQHDSTNNNSLSRNAITFIEEYSEDKFLIGTRAGGLNAFDYTAQKFKHYKHDPASSNSISGNRVKSIVAYSDSVYWMTTDAGLDAFNFRTGCFTHLMPIPNNTTGFLASNFGWLLKDREGNIWISWGAAVQKYNPRLQNFGHFKQEPGNTNSLNNNWVWSMREDRDGILWIGTIGGGLNSFDRVNNKWHHYKHDPNDPSSLGGDDIWDILESRDGLLWITTPEGLDCMDKKTGKFIHYKHDKADSNSISSGFWLSNIIEDRKGNIWVGTTTGLNRFDRKAKKFHHYNHNPADTNSLTSNYIRALFEDRHGNIWVGTGGSGLNYLNPETNTVRRFFCDRELKSAYKPHVNCIILDRKEKIWIGTGNGLAFLDPVTGETALYGTKDGMPAESIFRLEEDNYGRIWSTSYAGITRFDPETKQIRCFDLGDGIQSRNFSNNCGGRSKRTGEIFFGGQNGFNIFHPNSIHVHTYKPVVVINKLRRFNNDSASGLEVEETMIGRKAISLSHHENVLSFEFLSISLDKPAQNLYAYQLKGLNDHWIPLGTKREVTFAGLPAGNYTLMVKGSNGDGIWNDVPTELSITIKPAWYRTWLFYAVCVLAVALLIYMLFRYRLQQKLLVLQVRNRLHRDLHDDVGATLSSVKAYSEILQSDPDNKLISGLINENAAEMIDRLEVIAWATNPQHDNFKSLSDIMLRFANPITHAKNIDFEFQKDGTPDQLLLPGDIRQNILLIFKEAINNIVKHAKATSCQVQFFIKNNKFFLQIEDNGIGFEEPATTNRSGLKNMKKRAQELNGHLEITSKPGKGTCIQLVLPYPFRIPNTWEKKQSLS